MPDAKADAPRGTAGPTGHVPELDGLRGLAILGVMLFHQTVMVPASQLDRTLADLSVYLSSGVDLFFVLSGYLITGILYDSRSGSHYYRNFYARRFLRIFPLYYAVLLVALVILPHVPHPRHAKWGHITGWNQVWYWLYLSNWSIALGGHGMRHGMIDISWSLSIEEQFYLIWPVVVRSFDRRRLLAICVGLIATAFATRLVLRLAGAPLSWATLTTPARMDGLAIGALIALQCRGPGGIARLVPRARRVLAAVAVAVAALALAPLWLGAQPGGRLWNALGVLSDTVGQSSLVILYGALLILAVGTRPVGLAARLCGAGWLRTLGVYSYALYLFHVPIAAAMRETLYGPAQFPTLWGSPLPGQLLFYVVASVPALGAAWLSWHLFEKHFLKLKRYFPTRHERARPVGLVHDVDHPVEPAGSTAPASSVLGSP